MGNLIKLARVDQNVRRLLIVTKEEDGSIEKDGLKIEVIPAWRFLLELASR